MRRAVLSIIDQASLSILTLVVVVSASRQGSLHEAGVLALFQAGVAIVLIVNRAGIADAAVLAGFESGRDEGVAREALGASMRLGFIASPAIAIVGIASGAQVAAIVIWACCLPLVCLWDTGRVEAVRDGKGHLSALSDLAALSLAAVLLWGGVDAVVLWPLVTSVSALLLMVGLRLLPRGGAWWREVGRRGRPLVIEMMLGSALQQILVFCLAGAASASDVGAIRVAQSVMGPATMPLIALSPVLLSGFGRIGFRAAVRQVPWIMLLLVGGTVTLGLAVAAALQFLPTSGESFGTRLLGADWSHVGPLLVPLIIAGGLGAATLVLGTLARVGNVTSSANRLRVFAIVPQVGAFFALASRGAEGAAWGFACIAAITLATYVRSLLKMPHHNAW